jgi:hypothetical protein
MADGLFSAKLIEPLSPQNLKIQSIGADSA